MSTRGGGGGRERTIKIKNKINEGNRISTISFYIQPSGKQYKSKYKLKIKTSC